MRALVVPTARPERLAGFLDAWWKEPFDHILVVEDAPARSLDLGKNDRRVQVYSWEEIDRELPVPEIISRRDSAIRCFGFWKAWQLGCSLICTLDDDCLPIRPNSYLVRRHAANLQRTPRWASSVPGVRVRGLPYVNRGALASVMVSMGLWAGHLDIDAVTTLSGGNREWSDKAALRRVRTQVLPAAQYFPICGMNLAFRREVACLMYFPPMGRDSPYARFDDIWCGLLLQRICRHLGLSITVGRPLVRHERASDPLVNLAKEAPGVRDHESLWEVVDGIRLTAQTPLGCMEQAGQALVAFGQESRELAYHPYLVRWGESIQHWCKLFAATTTDNGSVANGNSVVQGNGRAVASSSAQVEVLR